jgi:hypothetical protein
VIVAHLDRLYRHRRGLEQLLDLLDPRLVGVEAVQGVQPPMRPSLVSARWIITTSTRARTANRSPTYETGETAIDDDLPYPEPVSASAGQHRIDS